MSNELEQSFGQPAMRPAFDAAWRTAKGLAGSIALGRGPELKPASAAQDHLLTIDLHKSYRKGAIEVPVLCGVSMSVQRGEFLAIVGQSGSGKSTLLHLLGTLDAPDQGEVYYAGQRIDNRPAAARDRLRNRQFGMIFQFYHLLPELSTLENVLAPLMIAHGVWSYLRAAPPTSGAGRGLAGTGRPEPPAEAPPPRAIGGGDAAGGHRPGPGGGARSAAGRRAHRKSGSGHRPRDYPHSANLEPPAEPHYSNGHARSGDCRSGRPDRPPGQRKN